MKILVCVKQVPNTSEVKINPDGTLKRDGVLSIMNPDDKAGLEFALQLKEEHNAEVTCITMGPLQAKKVLLEAVAMGADKGVLLTDRAFAGSDTLATSKALAALIRTLEFDLVIAGRQAIDGDTAQVGPQIAEHLNIPQVSYALDIKKVDNSVVVKRQFENGYQMLKVQLPALVTVLSNAVDARYMNVNRIVKATSEDVIEVKTVNDITIDLKELGIKGSPTKVKSTFNKEYSNKRDVHDNLDTKDAVKLIVETLKNKHLV